MDRIHDMRHPGSPHPAYPDALRVAERLLSKTAAAQGGCVAWTGATNARGYGRFRSGARGSKVLYAHRAAYELLMGPIPEGLLLDHVCHTRDTSCPGGDSCPHRRCINPHHLEPVTSRENTFRSPHALTALNVRKTRCDNGHAFDEANTYVQADSKRRCRACARADKERFNAARPATS